LGFASLSANLQKPRLRVLEHKLESHDQAIAGILNAIRELMRPPEPRKTRPIGFVTDKQK
jgi:hypothetical protein